MAFLMSVKAEEKRETLMKLIVDSKVLRPKVRQFYFKLLAPQNQLSEAYKKIQQMDLDDLINYIEQPN